MILAGACDKKKDDVIYPLSEYPQIVTFDDEGDGDLEDEDNFSFTLTLVDRVDPDKVELSGRIVPLDAAVTVSFEITDKQGFANTGDYIKGWKAFYEIDDCTTSDDLTMQFDPVTGKGSVEFPAGVEEVEVEFETDDAFFDDNIINDERSIEMKLNGVEGNGVVVQSGITFKYEVLDDETVQVDWELDISDADQFAAFKALFGAVSEDIAALEMADVDKIEISLEYEELTVAVELKEMETVEECGETEEINKTIEVEMELEEFDRNTGEGEMEAVGEGDEGEFVYSGEYKVDGATLELMLKGEYNGNETEDITLMLTK